MKTAISNLWLCHDCLFAAVNGETPEDSKHAKATELGLALLGPHLVPDFDSETGEGVLDFSWRMCSCCTCRLAGSRHRFAILGDE